MLEQPAQEAYPRALAFLLKSGATLQRRHGRMVAAHYGSVATEMAVCLKGAGLALRSDLEAVEIRGDPVALAEGLTSSLDALPPVTGEALFVGGVWVGRLAAGHAIIIGSPLALDRSLRALRSTLVRAIECGSRDSTAVVSIVGPRAQDLLGATGFTPGAGSRVESLRIEETDVVVLDQAPVWFTVTCPAAALGSVWHGLLSAGSEFGAMPVGCDAIDRLTASHRFSTPL